MNALNSQRIKVSESISTTAATTVTRSIAIGFHLRPLLLACCVVLFALLHFFTLPTWAEEEEIVVHQTYTILHTTGAIQAAATDEPPCTITARLTWRRGRKLVSVKYEWQQCQTEQVVQWELDSVQQASGSFTLRGNGKREVYEQQWPALADGDKIRLYTRINDLPSYTVETTYLYKKPIDAKIQTAKRDDGACFQFSGMVDPWGVFTAGDKSYTFHLDTQYWATPWLEGPNQPLVDWDVKFYEDAALQELRSEYRFTNVENPCYSSVPHCDAISLSVPSGTPIPATGMAVEVKITATDAAHYRLINKATGEIVAGPSLVPDFTVHALPAISYQAQVSADGVTWTTKGCEFHYTQEPVTPLCTGVTKIAPKEGEFLSASGQNVKVAIAATNATFNRIVNADTGEIVAAPSTEPIRAFFALSNINYQAQVSTDGAQWTDENCDFDYISNLPGSCASVAKIAPAEGESIQREGQGVKVEIKANNATIYRILNKNTGEVVAEPSTEPIREFFARPFIRYQAQVSDDGVEWSTEDCGVEYTSAPILPQCIRVTKIDPVEGERLPATGKSVLVEIKAVNATHYRIVNQATGEILAGPVTEARIEFVALPNTTYQAQIMGEDNLWTSVTCTVEYAPELLTPVCISVVSTPQNGSNIPRDGAAIKATITAEHATQYRVIVDGSVESGPHPLPNVILNALPRVRYQIEVSDAHGEQWNGAPDCILAFVVEPLPIQCNNVSTPVVAAATSGTEALVTVTCDADNATHYRIRDEHGTIVVPETTSNTMTFTARRGVTYHVEVRSDTTPWQSSPNCIFRLQQQQYFCALKADHYGDPGGLAWIEAWGETEGGDRQVDPTPLHQIVIDWNGKGQVTYTSAKSAVPWTTNQLLDFDSRPDVHDIGFGRYHIQAWVTIQGVDAPIFCDDIGHAQDHDNVVPDPGPFAKANPEGKFNRGDTPSRLPTVGRLPFDGGNGPEKIELILWAFEKAGNGMNARITAVANEGQPIARLGMASVTDFAKFDGLPAREGIVYGFQIGEHGPWSPLFCPKPDSNPTTITVFWGAGGQTWLSDGAAYGDCWWLTVAAARNGWVTVDEQVATYNALQPVIDWNGHRNLVFSMAQDRVTGQGPRMQDMVVGLQAEEWQGAVVPAVLPADFAEVVMGYQAE